ncbi:FtsH protease activity modulator HflK [Pseudazoarcus pumilus]|uniref:Protein HflK n=1 Tax=Pseudazoarcus pumilus TaxID=2067960 RepID=A0A2I6S4B5_9RHOO|nr:FtsH protease activity modulator HflK [Pseudazoarcus pumilus]AUN94092.1 FtsH protease activity modulator HflK [Pseudazoarcus pumilus]
MSLNDPRWGNNQGNDDDRRDGDRGRGGNQGPPDLEDVWRDFNQKLTGMLGGKGGGGRSGGGGGGSKMPNFGFRQIGGGIGALLVLLLVVWLASGFYTVDANQRGVVLRFGEHVKTSEPGLNWRIPYPIESHEIVDVTGVRTVEVGYRGTDRNKVLREALMLTQDANIVNIQFAVQYILGSPEDYLFNNRFPDDSVIQTAETAMREIVGKSTMDFVLYEGREDIAANAQQLMQTILDRYEAGILISRVTMQNAQPPEQVQAAFDDAVKAGQDRERLRNEGEAYRNEVVPRARGDAARLIEEAQGYRERVMANAEGEAARFTQVLEQYARAPEVTRERMYLETIQQVMSNTSKVMIDADSGGNLLLLPLDKLIGQTGSGAGTESSRAQSQTSSSTTTPIRQSQPIPFDPRDRDMMRNRELGGR